MAHKFRKNDKIIVISGSYKGKKSKIKSILKDRALVDGINIATVHKKSTNGGPGQIIKLEKSIHVSNLSHYEESLPSRVGFSIEGGEGKSFSRKVRISKKTGKKIDQF